MINPETADLSVTIEAQTMTALNPDMPHFARTVSAPPFVFVSGQLAFDGKTLIQGDVARQTTQCLRNICDALATVGLEAADIVKTTVWLHDPASFAEFDSAYATFFGHHRPARSTVSATLVVAGALVEIEAVALMRKP